MRTLHCNKQAVYFANFINKVCIKDDDGNLTGEYKINYTAPIRAMVNISSAKGESTVTQFGDHIEYDKIIVYTARELPLELKESSVLWIDETDITKPHDYVITKIAKSINSVSVAIRKVKVNE